MSIGLFETFCNVAWKVQNLNTMWMLICVKWRNCWKELSRLWECACEWKLCSSFSAPEIWLRCLCRGECVWSLGAFSLKKIVVCSDGLPPQPPRPPAPPPTHKSVVHPFPLPTGLSAFCTRPLSLLELLPSHRCPKMHLYANLAHSINDLTLRGRIFFLRQTTLCAKNLFLSEEWKSVLHFTLSVKRSVVI